MGYINADKLIEFIEGMHSYDEDNYFPVVRKLYLRRDITVIKKAVAKKHLEEVKRWYNERFGDGAWERSLKETHTATTSSGIIEMHPEETSEETVEIQTKEIP